MATHRRATSELQPRRASSLPGTPLPRHFNVPPSGSWAIPDGCGQVMDSVGVWLQVRHVPLGFTSIFGSIDLNEKTVMRLEPRTDCVTPE